MCHRFLLPLLTFAALAQQRPARPELFFREEWKPPMETPVTQEFISNPDLELKLYGPSGKEMRVTSEGGSPPHTFSGMCTQTCALALKNRVAFADLRGLPGCAGRRNFRIPPAAPDREARGRNLARPVQWSNPGWVANRRRGHPQASKVVESAPRTTLLRAPTSPGGCSR